MLHLRCAALLCSRSCCSLHIVMFKIFGSGNGAPSNAVSQLSESLDNRPPPPPAGAAGVTGADILDDLFGSLPPPLPAAPAPVSQVQSSTSSPTMPPPPTADGECLAIAPASHCEKVVEPAVLAPPVKVHVSSPLQSATLPSRASAWLRRAKLPQSSPCAAPLPIVTSDVVEYSEGSSLATPSAAEQAKQKRELAESSESAEYGGHESSKKQQEKMLRLFVVNGAVFELGVLLETVQAALQAEDERRLLDEARVVDNRLEEAITHRDKMRKFSSTVCSRQALLSFSSAFPDVHFFPWLTEKSKNVAREALQGVFEAAGANFSSGELDPGTLRNIEADVQKERARLEELCSTQARTESEALLLMCVMELSRAAITLSTSTVTAGQSTTADDAPQSSFGGTEKDLWEVNLAKNLAAIRQSTSPAAKAYLPGLLQLLSIARHTHMHRLSEDAQAGVALQMAELQSFFDRTLEPGHTLPQVDRRRGGRVCQLSGLHLPDDYCSSNNNSDCTYHPVVRKLWDRAAPKRVSPCASPK